MAASLRYLAGAGTAIGAWKEGGKDGSCNSRVKSTVTAREAGAQVYIKRVPELASDEVARASHYKLDQAAPVAAVDDLTNYDAIIIGTGTRFGRLSSQMASFLDQAGGLWMRGALHGKVGGAFTSSDRTASGAAACRGAFAPGFSTAHRDRSGDGRTAFGGLQRGREKIVAKAGLTGVSLHTLSRSVGSAAVSAGEALPMVGAILGHSDHRSTSIYAHMQRDPAQRAADRAPRSVGKKVL